MKKYFLNACDIKTMDIDAIMHRKDDARDHVEEVVKSIIDEVKSQGDAALKKFTIKYDNVTLDHITVPQAEIQEAYRMVESDIVELLKEAAENIKTFHQEQIQATWVKEFSPGISLGQLVTPLQRVGLYVPGGKGGYPSTVLMDAIPALVAGVPSIALITPPNKNGKVNPYLLVAADLVGIKEIYKVGGAQGIAALAYGTKTISPVNKIVGPGNIYVAIAKKLVFGKVDIDMIAGPSEICIIADETSKPAFIAADMLSQAEHDEMATSILITTKDIYNEVLKEIQKQMNNLSRKDIMEKSIHNNSKVFIVDSLDTAAALSNLIAPEHLEIMVEDPQVLLKKIIHAGAVFLGSYSPEPVGDYFAGPNHTLPTSGTAKFSSPLGVYDFVKRTSLIHYQKESLMNIGSKVIKFAEIEGFTAHANAIRRRLDD
ncbi:MAG: histidinol dehydrogenase [Eubacteriales bacterium]